MICDMAEGTMTDLNEEEKIPQQLAPTPSASLNLNSNKTCDGGEFQATKTSKISKMPKQKDASNIF